MNMLKQQEIKDMCRGWGADAVGIADVTSVAKDFLLSDKARRQIKRAVCLGVRVSRAILDEIDNQPTKMYFHHYRALNMFLDQLGIRLANYLQDKGFMALPVPASQIVDWEKQSAHLSHKTIGQLAGLGWIGRNNLLVNEEYGSQFRLASVLTDADIDPDTPVAAGCGTCRLCIDACPVGAIKERSEDFGHSRCFEKLKEFQKQQIVSQYICGICVKACRGKKK